jgi:hypothetical protein
MLYNSIGLLGQQQRRQAQLEWQPSLFKKPLTTGSGWPTRPSKGSLSRRPPLSNIMGQ